MFALTRVSRARRRNRHIIIASLSILIVVLTLDALRLLFLTFSTEKTSFLPHTRSHDRIFLASIHWNNEAVLKSNWSKAVTDTVDLLGLDNVFVAVLESGSWDNTKSVLRELDANLAAMGVPRSITLENTTHRDEVEQVPAASKEGWVWTPRGRKELRRVPYLARLRNRVMEEMIRNTEAASRRFDKVLWLNDVVFTAEDVLTLLQTNSGSYAAACSLDFAQPPNYYDTFALRDIEGHRTITQTWPYFLPGTSRDALISGSAVPVSSCWNGMVAMDAAPFYTPEPLKFHGIPDCLAAVHLEGSECCLVHADNPLSDLKGVWLNPDVKVGYNRLAYDAVDSPLSLWFPDIGERLRAMWHNRLVTIFSAPRRIAENLVVKRRLADWEATVPENRETHVKTGRSCLVDEMQVLVENGWKHL